MLPALVSVQVAYKVYLLYETPGTQVALERSLAGVDANVLDQVTLAPEGLVAVVALERAFVRVNFLVLI